MKITKTILIISMAIFGAGLLLVNSVQAQDELVVEFEQTPLFDEANFLPGESVTRWVKVTNNSGQPQRIAVEAINVSDSDNLGDELKLEIQEGANTPYSNSLSNFFNAGETYLSDLAAGNTTQYDFIVSFNSETGNPFQGKSLNFDILIGFQGTAGQVPPGEGGAGGGGGGGLPAGLTIRYEKDFYVGTTTATIVWLTSYKSTSRVIYGNQAGVFDLNNLPNYGYNDSTPEYDSPANPNGVTYHQVTLTGLLPNTTYYYRAISHASPPTISLEHSFTTLGVQEEIVEEFKEGVAGPEEVAEEKPEEIALGPEIVPLVEMPEIEEGAEAEAEEPVIAPEGMTSERMSSEEMPAEALEKEEGQKQGLLAAIGGLFEWPSLIYLLILLLIAILILLFLGRGRRQR